MKPWIAALVLSTAACTTVAPVKSPVSFIAATEPQRIWITRQDGSVTEIGVPRIVGDTLFGFRGLSFQEIPLKSITQVRALQSAPARTVAVALTLGLVAGATYWKMNAKSTSTPSNCTGGEEEIC
jgi:hypothetical protein